jgi:hypothetical protein
MDRVKALKSTKKGKLIAVTLLSVLLILVLLLINHQLFKSRIASLNSTAAEITAVIYSSNTPLLSSDQQTEVEKYSEGLSVGYPENLGKLSYPLSSEDRNTVSQIYKLTESSKLYVDTLSRLSEISNIVKTVPQKDLLTENPTLFINSYNNSINELEQYEDALDVDVLLKIFISIRDSAEFYVVNNRFDIFEARYDNVYSELDKEYRKSIDGFKEDVVNELNSLQRSIEKLE